MTKSIMSPRLAGLLVLICAASMLGLVVLYAYAPELRARQSSDANGLSLSAVGFAGLKELLALHGIPADIDRGPLARTIAKPSLTILTPSIDVSPKSLATYNASSPVLLILPKWETQPMQGHRTWVVKTGAYTTNALEQSLSALAGTVTIMRLSGSAHHIATTNAAAQGINLPTPVLKHIEEIQTILGGKPVLLATGNGPLLVQVKTKGEPVYILSEPDLMNNQGLADQGAAQIAVAIVRALRRGSGPVALDVTLDGLGRSPSMLRALFEPPFLGATLSALIACLLMGLHTAFRFGAPLRPQRFFALGKATLAGNSADLVRIMGREGAMARRYVAGARNLVLERLGARRISVAQQDALLATLERSNDTAISYDELAREAGAAANGRDLLRIAQQAYAWRRRITGGT